MLALLKKRKFVGLSYGTTKMAGRKNTKRREESEVQKWREEKKWYLLS
jgi:hypothetical protein